MIEIENRKMYWLPLKVPEENLAELERFDPDKYVDKDGNVDWEAWLRDVEKKSREEAQEVREMMYRLMETSKIWVGRFRYNS